MVGKILRTSVDTFGESTEGKKGIVKKNKLYTLFTIGAWYPVEVAIERRTRDEYILQHSPLLKMGGIFA